MAATALAWQPPPLHGNHPHREGRKWELLDTDLNVLAERLLGEVEHVRREEGLAVPAM